MLLCTESVGCMPTFRSIDFYPGRVTRYNREGQFLTATNLSWMETYAKYFATFTKRQQQVSVDIFTINIKLKGIGASKL